MRFLSFALAITLLNSVVYSQKITRGKVVDQNENPIANVKIAEPNSYNVVYSDDLGQFVLSYFATDSKIVFSHSDFDTLNLSLEKESNTLVFMTARQNANTYHLGYQVGFIDFGNKNQNKNLQNMPYFLGESDINRQLQMLPGIEQGNEGYSNLFVRGGEVDQNLLLYNGSPVFNSNHLYGLSSTFHHRSIENTGVYRGVAPAKFGGRTSSFINLESKKEDDFNEGLIGEFEMTLLNAGIYLQNIKKNKSYFTIAARRSWLDLLTPAETRENTLNANIYDLQMNFGKTLKNKDKWDFSFLNTRDLYFLGLDVTDSSNGSSPASLGIKETWRNIVTSFKYSQHFSSKLNAVHSLYYSDYKSKASLKQEIFDINISTIPTTEQLLTRGIRDVGVQSDWKYQYSNQYNFSFGIQSSFKSFLTGKYQFTTTGFPSQEDINNTQGKQRYDPSQEISLYADNNHRFNENVLLNYGVRSVFYNYNGYSKIAVEPRLHATMFMPNKDVLKLGYNRHNQFLSQLNLGQVGSPSNIWVPATENVLPQTSDVLEAGYERKLGTHHSASVNVYMKNMTRLNQVSNLNEANQPDADWQASVVQGSGKSYGVELFLQRSKGDFTGWLSYAYSKSLRNYPDLSNEEFLFNFDRPHMLKIYVNYTNDHSYWSFGANYIIGSGQLFTLPIGKYYDENEELQLEYNTLNNYRSPVYQRFDASVVKHKTSFGLEQEWRFYLYNALGSKNPIFVSADFEDNSLQRVSVTRNYFAFVPGIAYIVKF